ncbi:hypothetical protein [Halobellus captivus]|uniref:hypothetical protein n=1 Tax=Halobellus captivus TaxID=2592614 RepID=UPI0011AA5F2B|nr:hypothetical protein [Halobellus captivus]
MASAELLAALSGFFGALLTLGLPLVRHLYRQDKHVTRVLRLLEGDEEVEGDGVLPRLRDVEETTAEHRVAIRRSDAIQLNNDSKSS